MNKSKTRLWLWIFIDEMNIHSSRYSDKQVWGCGQTHRTNGCCGRGKSTLQIYIYNNFFGLNMQVLFQVASSVCIIDQTKHLSPVVQSTFCGCVHIKYKSKKGTPGFERFLELDYKNTCLWRLRTSDSNFFSSQSRLWKDDLFLSTGQNAKVKHLSQPTINRRWPLEAETYKTIHIEVNIKKAILG